MHGLWVDLDGPQTPAAVPRRRRISGNDRGRGLGRAPLPAPRKTEALTALLAEYGKTVPNEWKRPRSGKVG